MHIQLHYKHLIFLVVSFTPEAPESCTSTDLDCADPGTWDVDLDGCKCICMDGYSGSRCEIGTLPLGFLFTLTSHSFLSEH